MLAWDPVPWYATKEQNNMKLRVIKLIEGQFSPNNPTMHFDNLKGHKRSIFELIFLFFMECMLLLMHLWTYTNFLEIVQIEWETQDRKENTARGVALRTPYFRCK